MTARSIMRRASCGLVANVTSAGIPAPRQRPGSQARTLAGQPAVDQRVPARGRVSEVDGDLCVLDPPGGAGVLPLYAGRGGALLDVSGLIGHQYRAWVAQVLDHAGPKVVAHPVSVPFRAGQEVLHPSGDRSPACSAMVQQFLRGSPASSPRTNARALRRGSTLQKRPPTRTISSSSIPGHRSGSTLWPAASRRSSPVVTNRDDQTVAAPVSSTDTPKITNYGWSTRQTMSAGRHPYPYFGTTAEGWLCEGEAGRRYHRRAT